MKKYIYMFRETDSKNRNLYGGKGAILSEMTRLRLPVPQGFVVTTDMCTRYYEENCTLEEGFVKQLRQKMKQLEKLTGKNFGDEKNPLLVSIRSGARVSMPGMMDTVINIGLNDFIVENIAEEKGEEFAYDIYSHLIVCFGDYVFKHDRAEYDKVAETAKSKKDLAEKYKEVYARLQGEAFPQDPETQLVLAIKGVFNSWENERANIYRKTHNIPYEWGTAVTVQQMVFGNYSKNSGTGRLFSRNPITGVNEFYGFYMSNAQGEDMFFHEDKVVDIQEFAKLHPQMYEELTGIAKKLERFYKDLQEIEFTHEDEKLYILQARSRKRTAVAAIKMAYDSVQEGLNDEKHALLTIDASKLKELFDGGKLVEPSILTELNAVLSWADKYRDLKVMANAVNADDVKYAFDFGAEGVGLCRTEFLFRDEAHAKLLNDVLFGKNQEKALEKFVEYQEKEFEEMFRVCFDRQLTIRILDEVREYSQRNGETLSELGTRGARLALNRPEVIKAQVEAIITAAINVKKEYGTEISPEIMVPFVCDSAEFKRIKDIITGRANSLIERSGEKIDYLVGCMIEVPRAAIIANELAKYADFFSFDMNDLTQLTYGCSVNDENKIFDYYYRERIFAEDPFEQVDQNGVGKFVRIAVELGKATRRNIKLGFCAEQAGDPASIEFAHRVGLTYVSCVPERIALAKVAAAQAAIKYPKHTGLFRRK